jgi:hypothetical protein
MRENDRILFLYSNATGDEAPGDYVGNSCPQVISQARVYLRSLLQRNPIVYNAEYRPSI